MPENVDILDALAAALRERGELTVAATGWSMGGLLARAEALVLRPLGPRGAAWGSVAAFRRGDRWFVHRIVLRCGARYLAKGDAVRQPDWPWLRRSDIEAQVVAVVIGGRRRDLTGRGARWRARCQALRSLLGAGLWLLVTAARRCLRRRRF